MKMRKLSGNRKRMSTVRTIRCKQSSGPPKPPLTDLFRFSKMLPVRYACRITQLQSYTAGTSSTRSASEVGSEKAKCVPVAEWPTSEESKYFVRSVGGATTCALEPYWKLLGRSAWGDAGSAKMCRNCRWRAVLGWCWNLSNPMKLYRGLSEVKELKLILLFSYSLTLNSLS